MKVAFGRTQIIIEQDVLESILHNCLFVSGNRLLQGGVNLAISQHQLCCSVHPRISHAHYLANRYRFLVYAHSFRAISCAHSEIIHHLAEVAAERDFDILLRQPRQLMICLEEGLLACEAELSRRLPLAGLG